MKAKNNRVETYVAFLAAMLRDPDESDNCNAEAGKFFQLFNFLFEKNNQIIWKWKILW